ncbi:probable disease resistance protein At4g27220 [Oryza glaberrima]|uniref:probable disease resistance protein At4g27220 n=1 Tax=Oryza glaberrima TaxID=4538 RepID=UPI00023DEFBC|nr:probable disease resistance protein At4g27220 [Oryza glaberrima]XP_052138738.1 probable disease resistance protein At4g27220 [Oryza glaberrima]
MASYCCFWKAKQPIIVGLVQLVQRDQLISIQDMFRLLFRPEVGSIVIEGIGGSGKTWAAKAAYQVARTNNLFDDYIWVSLSINCSLRRCIDKIIACLSCEIREDLPVQRTKMMINEYLTKRKFLLVLDNAYFTEENILEHLGVPHPRRQNIGSKVIVTTRTGRTRGAVVPDTVIIPQPLTYEESYNLLRTKIGKEVGSSHILDLTSNFYGIPLSVILLAGVFCDVPNQDTLRELVHKAYITLGTKVSVFHTLQRLVKFAYHQLPNDQARHCFLYCLLFPEDQGIPVNDLIRFWIFDDLIIQSSKFHEASHIGKEILDVLLKRGMLYLEDNDHVRMHDVIRETVSGYGKENGYREQLDWKVDNPATKLERLSKLSTRISLMNTEMEYLDGSVQGLWISSLLLRGNSRMKYISEEFFHHVGMPGIVDLSFTRIKVLPNSISYLTTLRMLLLSGCGHLEEIQHIASLAQLEVLDASCCRSLRSIESGSFDHMMLLKLLDLSATSIKFLPSLPASRELRHLLLHNCPCLGSENTMRSNAILSDVKYIRFPYGVSKTGAVQNMQLGRIEDIMDWVDMLWLPCGLNFQLYDLFNMRVSFGVNEDSKTFVYASDAYFFQALKKDSPLWFNCFQKFHIVIAPLKDDQVMDAAAQLTETNFLFRNSFFKTKHFTHSIDRDRFLEINSTIGVSSDIEGILGNAELVCLNRLATSRISDLNITSMEAVRELWVENCDQLENLFSVDEIQVLVAFGSLQNLKISNIEKLSSLLKAVKNVISFSCLKHLLIDCCPNLKWIFPPMVHLPNLETMHVKFCDILERIFEDDSVLGDYAFPRLQSLELWELPELSCICGGTLPSLKNLKVRNCAKLRKIPVGVNENSPFVTTIGETFWWDSLIWDDESIKRWILFRKWGPMLPYLATEG